MKGPKAFLLGMIGEVRLENNGAMTHLQKYSPLGFLITWPFCFHFWFMWKKQYQTDFGEWVPGSEQGIYFRTPGWRYDSDHVSGMAPTWGYIGLHFD